MGLRSDKFVLILIRYARGTIFLIISSAVFTDLPEMDLANRT